jgi:hypothetical protein
MQAMRAEQERSQAVQWQKKSQRLRQGQIPPFPPLPPNDPRSSPCHFGFIYLAIFRTPVTHPSTYIYTMTSYLIRVQVRT